MKTIKSIILTIMIIFTLSSCTENSNESSSPAVSISEISIEESQEVESVILLREEIIKSTFMIQKTIYEYDEKSHVVSKKYFQDNKLYSSTNYRYDDKGFKNYFKIIYFNNSDYLEYSWTYSSTGKILIELRKNYMSGTLYETSVNYKYDEKDRIISEVTKDEKNNIIMDEITYEYIDDNGSFKNTKISNGETSTSILIFDSRGNLIENQKLNNEGTISSRRVMEYDDKNNQIKESYDDIEITFEYIYDGELIKKISTYHSKDGLCGYIEYTYNDAGDLIKQVDFDASGTQTSEKEFIYKWES